METTLPRCLFIAFPLVLLASITSCALSDSKGTPPERSHTLHLTNDDFLELFRAADRTALSDSYLEGRAIFPAGPFSDQDGRAAYKVAFSSRGEGVARWMQLDGMPSKIAYVPESPGPRSFSAPSYFDGNMHFWLLDECALVRDAERDDLIEAYRTYWVAPNGELGRIDRVWGEHTKDAPQNTPKARFVQILFAGGRGFAEHLTQVDHVTLAANGLLQVRGRGTYPHVTGEWELFVDVAAGYLVREATFRDGGSRVRVVTHGTIGEPPWTVAREGELSSREGFPTVTTSFLHMGEFSTVQQGIIENAANRLAELPFRTVNEAGRRLEYREGRLRTR